VVWVDVVWRNGEEMVKKWWVPIIVLFLGFLLRVFRLGDQSIWYDEGVSLYLAQQTPGQIIRHTAGDIHPPLYYLVLHVWTSVVGDSEFAAAFLSHGGCLQIEPEISEIIQ